jgi:NAD(P)-dependent dehydrogenase (short-subunit alcohol dehydrogenase family)
MTQHATTRITTPFGFASTSAEVLAGVDLSDRRAIVTGGASGFGVETARAPAGAGAAVTLAVRKTAEGEEVAADISRRTTSATSPWRSACTTPSPRRAARGSCR